MQIKTITMLICFGLAATAAAQGTPSGKSASSGGSSKSQLSEIRSLVYELQGRTEKLRDLMAVYRSLVEQRPKTWGGGADAKKEHEEQLAKWNSALDRQLRRVDEARAAVDDTMKRLDETATGTLPVSLGKEVANARNEADAERAAAQQALAKNKSKTVRTSKPAKQTAQAEKTAPPIPDDL
jgi:uncharacterized protein YukE